MVLELLHLRVVGVMERVQDANEVCDGEHPNKLLSGVVPQRGCADTIADEGVERLGEEVTLA